jgi:hypothetical protein
MKLETWGSILMPCIWGQHNGSQLLCAVAILPPNIASQSGAYPGPPPTTTTALIDTGATTTGITSALAAQLQLPPVGIMPIHGVGGVQHHNSHLFMVGFPFAVPPGAPLPANLPPPAPGQTAIQLHVLLNVIQGCAFQGGNAPFQVILGMDVLSSGSLVVQGGNRTFSFSF